MALFLYKSGPARKVPGRRGMTYTEEDWIDRTQTWRSWLFNMVDSTP
jgi:hypothetical protein